jgi:hypothetical protein
MIALKSLNLVSSSAISVNSAVSAIQRTKVASGVAETTKVVTTTW